MGLDITAYSNMQSLGKHAETWCEEEDHVTAATYSCFPNSFRGIPVLGKTYGFDNTEFLDGGCYEVDDVGVIDR